MQYMYIRFVLQKEPNNKRVKSTLTYYCFEIATLVINIYFKKRFLTVK